MAACTEEKWDEHIYWHFSSTQQSLEPWHLLQYIFGHEQKLDWNELIKLKQSLGVFKFIVYKILILENLYNIYNVTRILFSVLNFSELKVKPDQ